MEQSKIDNVEEIMEGIGVKVNLTVDFRIVREVLTRMGMVNDQKKEVYPSCYILHKRGNYYICHFKELFILDGKGGDISQEDYARRDSIARLLEQWELVDIQQDIPVERTFVKVLPKSEIDKYTIVHKYSIGKKRSA